MTISDLTRTDLHLVSLHGEVQDLDGVVVARTPGNPTYRWGNFILLNSCPEPGDLEPLIHRARQLFRDQPESLHALIRWDGEAIPETLESWATQLGMTNDNGMAMRAGRLEARTHPELAVRPLDLEKDWVEIEELNRTCDPEEIPEQPDYVLFKERLRQSWKVWAKQDGFTWWGGFIDDRLVGQLGMAVCPGGFGRFQSVETAPDMRRQGICSTLVSTVGNHALDHLQCRELLLGIDPEGNASRVYRKLGFTLEDWNHGLVMIDATEYDQAP